MCSGNCNCNCDQVTIPSISGPAGVDGLNAFTKTTASFVVPNIGSNVTLAVNNTNPLTGIWAQPNQDIFIKDAGYYRVVSSTATSIVCTNLGVNGNEVPGVTVGSLKYVVPAGRSANVQFNDFSEDFYVSTPQAFGDYDPFNVGASSIEYTNYCLSKDKDGIIVRAAILTSATKATYTSFQFKIQGSVCFTSALSDYPPSARVNYTVEIYRVSDTSVQVETREEVTDTVTKATTVYRYYNDAFAVSDLDSPGNYNVNLQFYVSSDVAHTLTWQSLTNIKK